MTSRMQQRRDTAANWTSNNPTLAAGEIGFETDTKKLKIGDGTTAWTSLAYAIGSVSLTSGVTGTLPIANGGTNLTTYTTGDVVYASATNTLSKLGIGSTGQILTVSGGIPSWAAAPITLPTQTGNSGKYLTTDGTNASWATITTDPNPSIFMLMGS